MYFLYAMFDWTIWILLPGVVFALYAQAKVRSTFAKYSRVRSGRGVTGAQAARELLDAHGLFDVNIEHIPGDLSDHYDPKAKVLRLSRTVYGSDSLAALGVAAHEAGHAVQDAENYTALKLRHMIFPVAQIGSYAAWPIFFIGLFIGGMKGLPLGRMMMDVGIVMFSAYVVFALVTLPVEFNASKRALALLESRGIVTVAERSDAGKVLNAAAMTYLAAALMAILQLIRLLIIRGDD